MNNIVKIRPLALPGVEIFMVVKCTPPPPRTTHNNLYRAGTERVKISCKNTSDEFSKYVLKYLGPEYWSKTYPECGGSAQSPIDIPLKYPGKR